MKMAQSHKPGSDRGEALNTHPSNSKPMLMSTPICMIIGIKWVLVFFLFIANLRHHSFIERLWCSEEIRELTWNQRPGA